MLEFLTSLFHTLATPIVRHRRIIRVDEWFYDYLRHAPRIRHRREWGPLEPPAL